MTKKEIIMNTYNFYKDNLDKFAVDDLGNCRYLTEDGKKCAVGRYMTEGKHQIILEISIGCHVYIQKKNSLYQKLEDMNNHFGRVYKTNFMIVQLFI